MRCVSLLLCSALFALAGCVFDGPQIDTVSGDRFGQSAPVSKSYRPRPQPQASLETAARVDTLSRQLLAANAKLGLQPKFATIGAPTPEIFHLGTTQIFITEGLVKLCTTEGQLAAVLSLEMARMATERTVLAATEKAVPERLPPINERIGNDNAGSFGAPDLLSRAELGKYEAERKKRQAARAVTPNPDLIARDILTSSGFKASEFDAAAEAIKTAGENNALAKQMQTGAAVSPAQ